MARKRKNIKQESMKSKPFDIIIIDGKNMCYIYYHAFRMLKSSSGERTGIFHGFLSLLIRLREKNMKSKIIVAWEGGKLKRSEMLKSYKSNRTNTNKEFDEQCYLLQSYLGMLKKKKKHSYGYEADDVAATYVDTSESERILLVSKDDDWLELTSREKEVYFWRKNNVLSYEDLKQTKGFPPEKIAIYVVLKGKDANAVKGIPYFPKTFAVEILNKEFNTIEDIFKLRFLKKFSEIYNKWKKYLKDNKKNLIKKYNIIKLNRNIIMEDLPCEKKNISKLKKILISLELFKVLEGIKRIRRMKKNIK